MKQDGQHTQDTQRIQEGPQGEAMGQRIRLAEACAPSGEASGKQNTEGRQRLVKLENSAQVKDSLRMSANTTQEIEEQLLALFPIDPQYIGMYFSTSQEGTMHRKYFEGEIDPDALMVYVKLYLKKHPPLS
jgi:hypothetical protein